jgi:5,10-methylenetetrahydromethanopterin reductase
MLLSFQMLPEQPASELLEAAALADRLGYHACYSADEIYHKDAWLLFAAIAQRTERIRLGPCVLRSTCGSRPMWLSSQRRSMS